MAIYLACGALADPRVLEHLQSGDQAAADGLLIDDPTGRIDDIARALGLTPAPVTLEDGRTALALNSDIPAAVLAGALPEVMERLSLTDPDTVRAALPRILTRAEARLRAAAEPGPDEPHTASAVRKPVHRGFFNYDVLSLTHPRFDGTTQTVEREVFVGSDATIVLPYDPVRDRVLLVEQFRTGPFARGSRNPWSLEPVAGLIDPGETPDRTARREAEEEAGITLRALEFVCAAYPSPGITTEFYHLYVGLCDLPDTGSALTGVLAEGEDIRTHVMTYGAFQAHVRAAGSNVLPLITIGHWLALNRERLRRAG